MLRKYHFGRFLSFLLIFSLGNVSVFSETLLLPTRTGNSFFLQIEGKREGRYKPSHPIETFYSFGDKVLSAFVSTSHLHLYIIDINAKTEWKVDQEIYAFKPNLLITKLEDSLRFYTPELMDTPTKYISIQNWLEENSPIPYPYIINKTDIYYCFKKFVVKQSLKNPEVRDTVYRINDSLYIPNNSGNIVVSTNGRFLYVKSTAKIEVYDLENRVLSKSFHPGGKYFRISEAPNDELIVIQSQHPYEIYTYNPVLGTKKTISKKRFAYDFALTKSGFWFSSRGIWFIRLLQRTQIYKYSFDTQKLTREKTMFYTGYYNTPWTVLEN